MLGFGELGIGDPHSEHVQICDIQCFTKGKKCHSFYKSIFIKFSQMLTVFFKNIKEDAQILSACTGSACWEQIRAGTVEIGQVVF